MEPRNLFQEFKFQLFSGTMTNRLVIINVMVFVFIILLEAIFRLLKMDGAIIENFCSLIFIAVTIRIRSRKLVSMMLLFLT